VVDRRTILLGLAGVASAGVVSRSCQAQVRNLVSGSHNGAVAKARPALRQSGHPDFGSIQLSQLPIGGGGFVTGIDISSDGQRFVCRTDVANAYIRNKADAAWLPLFSPATMAQQDYDPLPPLKDKADGQGVAAVRIAPSDKNRVYASYYGFIWRSDDGGRTVRRTRSPQLAMPSNAGLQRLYNRTIDVDRLNPDRIVVGTCGEGMWFSLDGGSGWKRAELPAAGQSLDGKAGIHLVLIDRSKRDRIYVFVTGRGLFRSDDGPAGKFTLMAGGPSHAAGLIQSSDNSIYVTEQIKAGGGSVWRFSPDSGWVSGRPAYEAATLAAHPREPASLIASNANGFIMTSRDRGQSWTSHEGVKWKRTEGEVAWMRDLISFFPAEMVFDPIAPDHLYVAQGVGVARASGPVGPLQVTDWSAGIEELCAVDILAVPGGKLFLSAWDKSFWRVDDPTAYANSFRYPVPEGRQPNVDLVAYGSYMDYAGDDPNYVVGVIAASDATRPGYTADGGVSWQSFAGTPPEGWGLGGCIAASTRNNIVLLPSNNGVGAYTLDGGKSWASIKLDGVKSTAAFANAFYVKRQNITADKSRPGTFALVYTTMRNNDYSEPLGGLWVTRDGGRSWTQLLKGVIGPGSTNPHEVARKGLEARQFWQCQLDYVPGRSGELVYTPHADFDADRFYWSRDDGRSWSELHPAIRNVRAFGFGRSAPGQERPVLYFWGRVQGREGLYASLDWFASEPRLITRFPSQMLAKIESIGGDLERFGRVYVGTSCAGWVQVDISAG
jgi:hypothetical protein